MTLSAYSVIYAAGALASLLVAENLWRKLGLPPYRLRFVSVLLLACGLAGAYALVGIANALPRSGELIRSGTSMLGGVIFGIPLLIVISKAMQCPPTVTFDVAAVVAPLGFGIGRFGCLQAGCCFAEWFGVPVQVVASIADFAAFTAFFSVVRRTGSDGRFLYLFLTFYGFKRFALGFLRADDPPVLGVIAVPQVFGLVLGSCGLLGLVFWWRRQDVTLYPSDAGAAGPPCLTEERVASRTEGSPPGGFRAPRDGCPGRRSDRPETETPRPGVFATA